MKLNARRNIGLIIGIALYLLLLYLIVITEKGNANANIKNLYDAIWYSIVTLTTVGYGDFYPVTPLGKILGLLFIISSIGLIGYLIGNITNKIRTLMVKKKEGFYGTSFTSHYVIIGWNSFSKLVIKQIINAGLKVVVVTDDKEDIEQIYELYKPQQIFVLLTDFTNYESLEKANITNSQSVFINLQDDTDSLVFLINTKKMFPGLNFVVSVNKPDLKETYLSLGVDKVVSRNEIASNIVASFIFEPHVANFTEDLIATSVQQTDYDIQQYKVIGSNPYLNKDYLDAFVDIKQKFDCILLGLVQKGSNNRDEIKKNPPAGTKIELNNYMLLISNGFCKKNIEKAFGVKEGM